MTVTAPVIETSTAEIGHYVSTKEFQTWPVAVGDGQRQIQQFIFSSLPGTTGGTFEGAINGGRNYSHEILIEGMPLGRNLQGGSNNEMSPPTEAVSEFKLQTGTLGAEFGGGQTAVANFVVKSGTNQLHGSGAVYLMDAAWDAKPFVAKALGQATPVRDQQNWAVAMGGPISLPKLYSGRDRSFFFATFEQTHSPGTDVHGLPLAADPGVPERRLLTPLRCRLHRRRPLGHGRRDRRARPAYPLRPGLRPALDARRQRQRGPGSLPEQPGSTRGVGRGVAQHPRTGPLGHAGARTPVQQPAGARDLLSGVRAEHVRDQARPGD